MKTYIGLILLLASVAFAHGDQLTGELEVNHVVGGKAVPKQETLLEITYSDETGLPVTDFQVNHEKLNHMIVVSSDLSRFAHVHPRLNADDSGEFAVTLNPASAIHPDKNIDNTNINGVLTEEGRYFVFTEVVPTENTPVEHGHGGHGAHDTSGHDHGEVPLVRFSFETKNASNGPVTPLSVLTPIKTEGNIDTYALVLDKDLNATTAEKAQYKANLEVEVMDMPGIRMVEFRLELLEKHMGTHFMAASLVNWLGMLGHGILISEAGTKVEDKSFNHVHAMGEEDGEHDHDMNRSVTAKKLTFHIHENAPTPGNYKLWLQVKKKTGEVLTLPFALAIK